MLFLWGNLVFHLQVNLCKDVHGKYGFTLLDTLPVQIGHVEQGETNHYINRLLLQRFCDSYRFNPYHLVPRLICCFQHYQILIGLTQGQSLSLYM